MEGVLITVNNYVGGMKSPSTVTSHKYAGKKKDTQNAETSRSCGVSEKIDKQNAAVIIQKYMRGAVYRNRLKVFDVFNYESLAISILDDLVERYISEEFLPNILIDVFTGKTDDYQSVSVEDHIAYDTCTKIIQEVIHQELLFVSKLAVKEHVNMYLSLQYKGADPILSVVNRLVDTQTALLAREVVQEALRELAAEFLFVQQFEVIFNSMIDPMLIGIVMDAWYESGLEREGELILDSVLSKITFDVVSGLLGEREESIEDHRREKELAQVSVYINKLLEKTLMNQLLELVATSGQSIVLREQLHWFLQNKMAQSMFDRIITTTTKIKRITENEISRNEFQRLSSDLIFNTLFQEFLNELDTNEIAVNQFENS